MIIKQKGYKNRDKSSKMDRKDKIVIINQITKIKKVKIIKIMRINWMVLCRNIYGNMLIELMIKYKLFLRKYYKISINMY
jgi:hypothetical protein